MNIEDVKPKIRELAEKYSLSLLLLFGSQASGNTHSDSDFDLAYVSYNKLSFNDEVNFNTDLTGIFQNDKVSLVNIRMASPLLLKQIVANCVVLYEKERYSFEDLSTYAFHIYEDARPLFDLRRHYIEYKMREYKNA